MCKGVEEMRKCVFHFLTWIFKHPCGIGQRNRQALKFTRRKRGHRLFFPRNTAKLRWQKQYVACDPCKHYFSHFVPALIVAFLLTPELDRWSSFLHIIGSKLWCVLSIVKSYLHSKARICLWHWIVFIFKSKRVSIFFSQHLLLHLFSCTALFLIF